jgi:hypothetical protein
VFVSMVEGVDVVEATDLLGRLVRSATAPRRGRFRASAVVTTVQGPPPAEMPRRFSPFREDGPRRTGAVELGCVVTIRADDQWEVVTDDGGTYRRNGDALAVGFPGHESFDMEVGDVRAPNTEWAHYSEHWAEELVLPHRLVGLLDEVQVVGEARGRPRWRGRSSLRQPEAYSGIAREEVLEVEFTADLDLGVIVAATATTWNHHVDRYALEVLDDRSGDLGP